HGVQVEAVVVGQKHDGVGRRQFLGNGLDAHDSSVDVLGNMWVCGTHLGAESQQAVGDDQSRGLSGVGRVGLVGEAEEQDSGAVQGQTPAVQGQHEPPHHVVGHVVVDVVGQLHDTDGQS